MQNVTKSLVCALFLALVGCSTYSDFPPPPNGAPCQSVADCGSRGACWAWSCVAGSCLAVGSPDLDNAGQPTTCDMSIDGSPGTCHAGQCNPDNGTTEQCFPAFPPDCYPPASAYQCGATTTIADERDGQCERLWCLDSTLTLVDKGDGWPCAAREDGSPEFKQGQCVARRCSARLF